MPTLEEARLIHVRILERLERGEHEQVRQRYEHVFLTPKLQQQCIADYDRWLGERDEAQRERDELDVANKRNVKWHMYEAKRAAQAEARVRVLEEALRENVGDAYGLITQGESPTQRRQPAAQRIYDRAKDALTASTEEKHG